MRARDYVLHLSSPCAIEIVKRNSIGGALVIRLPRLSDSAKSPELTLCNRWSAKVNVADAGDHGVEALCRVCLRRALRER